MSGESEAIHFIQDAGDNGGDVCGLMELKDDQIIFYINGEKNYERFSKIETDNRAQLEVPDEVTKSEEVANGGQAL